MTIVKRFVISLSLIIFGFTSFSQTENGKAQITFNNLTHNFGQIEYGSDGSANFIFKNTGQSPLSLNNVKSTCGCTVPHWPHTPIAPGESDTIKVVYNTRRSGAFNKGITVYSNATNQTIRLIIKGEVKKPDNLPVLGEPAKE